MTITLDYVYALLHLLLGQFYTYVMLDFTSTSSLVVKLLGVDFDDVAIELR